MVIYLYLSLACSSNHLQYPNLRRLSLDNYYVHILILLCSLRYYHNLLLPHHKEFQVYNRKKRHYTQNLLWCDMVVICFNKGQNIIIFSYYSTISSYFLVNYLFDPFQYALSWFVKGCRHLSIEQWLRQPSYYLCI